MSFPQESVNCRSMSPLNPSRSSNSHTRLNPASEVTRAPWESSFKEALKES